MKLLVYVPQLSPRIKYIFGFIFEDLLKTELSFTTNTEEFKQSTLPKFSYAPQPLATELFFKSSSLLFEHKIIEQEIKTTTFAELKVPFPVTESTLPFDPFAASFYFLSRYEEYLPFKIPQNQLYPAESSLQHQFSLLKFPVIDSWALILKNILLKHFPGLPFGVKHFSFQPLYLTRPATKRVKKNMLFNAIKRIKNYIERKINNKAKNIAVIREVITDMQRYKLAQKTPVLTPNQANGHHLDANMQIPKSYVKLTKSKIRNDYSMYYSNRPGFRAGTSIPFYWYDLQLEKVTQLLLHPVAATDLTLLNNKTDDLLLQLNELIDHVKLVNGDFYFLSLCDDIRPQ